jgi:hypothetical protein
MNGEDTWRQFSENNLNDPSVLKRATRLNIDLEDGLEPALDDFGSVERLERVATAKNFYNDPNLADSDPILAIFGLPFEGHAGVSSRPAPS